MKKVHIGSDFDDFLREERLLDTSEVTAAKRVTAFQAARLQPNHRGLRERLLARRGGA